MSQIYLEELLRPYVRNAYRWISDALNNSLTRPDERYEFPDIGTRSTSTRLLIEGGSNSVAFLQEASWGKAQLTRLQTTAETKTMIARRVLARDSSDDVVMGVPPNQFGNESELGWAPWVFAGDPVVEAPHRPPLAWKDFGQEVQDRILMAARVSAAESQVQPMLLIAFLVPETWTGEPNRIVWRIVELARLNRTTFDLPSKGSFVHRRSWRHWPKVQRLLSDKAPLQWMYSPTDVSPEALVCRQGSVEDRLMDLRIAQVGIGAIGSIMVKSLLKLSPQQMLLIDNEKLEAGNLVRHEGLSTSLHQPKSVAMQEFAMPLTESHACRSFTDNILQPSDELNQELGNTDLVIDTTGDHGVHAYLAKWRRLSRARLAWAYITPGPDFGFLILRRPGSTLDVSEAELEVKEHLDADTWSQIELADSAAENLVWPEPGCYHPTFRAPYHRLTTMVSSFVSTLLAWLDQDSSDLITVFHLADRNDVLGTDCRILLQLSP